MTDKVSDLTAIHEAVLDYVEGIYQADPTRIIRSVHPNLAKIGFIAQPSGYLEAPLSYVEMVEAVKTYNADGKIPPEAPKTITVFELLDQTASVKLEAWWGRDYIHLAKFDGRWMIVQVLWQSHPPQTISGALGG